MHVAGVPWLRTFAWNGATRGLVLVAAQALLTR
jgi:hypothetical protein